MFSDDEKIVTSLIFYDDKTTRMNRRGIEFPGFLVILSAARTGAGNEDARGDL